MRNLQRSLFPQREECWSIALKNMNTSSKKTIQLGEDVPNNILYPVPHRQFVFSIPIETPLKP